MPDDFGSMVTAENVSDYLADYGTVTAAETKTCQIPVLMYHHIADGDEDDMIVSPETFAEQMKALWEAGYTTVSLRDLVDYVAGSADLPEHPVLITFDDGYLSNYEIAYPILKANSMKAAVFAVGSQMGADTYKNDGENHIYPHFGVEEAKEMLASGLIEIQSHTYDLHQASRYETGEAAENMLRPEDMSESEWLERLREDDTLEREALSLDGENELFAVAFPEGKSDDDVRALMAERGYRVMLTTDGGINTLVRGLPQTLYGLKRIYVSEETPESLLEKLKP
jgi:peptidoglycan/xylan/chitin deacetylase (PgdA/CDA1 family)